MSQDSRPAGPENQQQFTLLSTTPSFCAVFVVCLSVSGLVGLMLWQ